MKAPVPGRVGETVRTADDALAAIAGMVGADPFDPKPRDIYLRVRRYVSEHEQMRSCLARICDEADRATKVLREVDEEET